MLERIGHGAHDLRYAANRIGVLYAIAIGVAGADFAVAEQAADGARDPLLASQVARRMDAFVERAMTPRQRLDAERATDNRCL